MGTEVAPKSLVVPKSSRVFEMAGVIEHLSESSRDGYSQLEVRLTSGETMLTPWPRPFGGSFDYEFQLEPGVKFAARSFIVPVVDSDRQSLTYGKVVNAKRYAIAESDSLESVMTLEAYLATDYNGKPKTTAAVAEDAKAF